MENMHDLPYLPANQLGPEVTACMTAVCASVKSVLSAGVQCGVQVQQTVSKLFSLPLRIHLTEYFMWVLIHGQKIHCFSR